MDPTEQLTTYTNSGGVPDDITQTATPQHDAGSPHTAAIELLEINTETISEGEGSGTAFIDYTGDLYQTTTTTAIIPYRTPISKTQTQFVPPTPPSKTPNQPTQLTSPLPPTVPKPLKTYPPPPSTRAKTKDPIAHLTSQQLAQLDPTGTRQHLFSRANREAAKVGDVLLVRQRNGDPFAGVCLNIRRRGVDTAILLRNQLTRIGVEMWFKVYSPNVVGVEVVQRREKRARRARLYYMRKPKHDMGSVQNIVLQYQRQKMALGSGENRKGKGSDSGKRGMKSNK